MSAKRILANSEHEVAYQELVALVGRHAAEVSAVELLAIAANMLGKMIALQDQRTMTRERALEIVLKNIEAGNQQAIDDLAGSVAGHG